MFATRLRRGHTPAVMVSAQHLVRHLRTTARSGVADDHLVAVTHDHALEGPGLVSPAAAAPAQCGDLEDFHPIRQLDQPGRAGKQPGPEVGGDPERVDVNAELWFEQSVSIGAMMRWKEGFGVQATYRHQMQWRFHYAVDFPLNGLANRNFGSHEIGLTWDFGRKPIAYQSPRYF